MLSYSQVNRASTVPGAVCCRVKREAGETPARTRRCKAEVLLQYVTGYSPGRRSRAMIAKSEDLPGMKLDSHESLAENMHVRPESLALQGFGLDRQAVSFTVFRRRRRRQHAGFWPALLRRFFLSGGNMPQHLSSLPPVPRRPRKDAFP